MEGDISITRERMKTPRAAAIAGIVFSVLLISILILIRVSIPKDISQEIDWLTKDWSMINIALNLLPFSGIAFLWFIGVVRDRLGEHEDRFFQQFFLAADSCF